MNFIEKMRECVWVLRGEAHDAKVMLYTKTGVAISGNLLLTCYHGCESGNAVLTGRKVLDKKFSCKFERVHQRPDMDLLLLKCVDSISKQFEYFPISDEESLLDGATVYTMGHPHRSLGSLYPRKVLFPCQKITHSEFLNSSTCENYVKSDVQFSRCRKMGDIYNKAYFKENNTHMFRKLNRDLPIVVSTGVPIQSGLSGGPLVTEKGDIMGIAINGDDYTTYYVHASAIKAFLAEYYAGQQAHTKS